VFAKNDDGGFGVGAWQFLVRVLRYIELAVLVFLQCTGALLFRAAPCRLNLNKVGICSEFPLDVRSYFSLIARAIEALCGIWANSKSFLLAPGSRADRVGQQATQRTVATGMSGQIPIPSKELLLARL
jgi:hypothetical protein